MEIGLGKLFGKRSSAGLADLTSNLPPYIKSNDDLDGVFETMWLLVTGDTIPNNVDYHVLSEKEFVDERLRHGKRTTTFYVMNENNGRKWRYGDVGCVVELKMKNLNNTTIRHYSAFAVENPVFVVLETLGHEGLGHARYLLAKPNAPLENDILGETAAFIGEQQGIKALRVKLPPDTCRFPEFHKRAHDYAKKLVERFGADSAWDKILAVENEEELKAIC